MERKDKILVLGSTGLIGTAITEVCESYRLRCVGLTHQDVDIKDSALLGSVIRKYNPAVIVNATGLVGIGICEDNPWLAISVNAASVCSLVDLCEMNDILLIQPSTHNVFDGTKDGYYTEEDIPRPLQIYGLTKYLSEKIVSRCRKHYIVRYPTLFGRRSNNKSAFPTKIIDWIKEGKEFKISYDKIDSPSYSIDVAKATLNLPLTKPFGTYHIANSGMTNYHAFVLKISEILGIDAKVTPVREKEFEVKAPNALKTAMSSVKLEPLRSWEEALEEYLNGC